MALALGLIAAGGAGAGAAEMSEKRVAANAVTELAFTANATGRFSIEIHAQSTGGAAHEDAPLAVIEVYPR